jgi:type I restriction enzyme M protein
MLISCIAYLKEHNLEWRNLKVYGQEINQLTSAIGRMNLFLHGVQTFDIVNDDTLVQPGFIVNGQLQKFDVVLANPPYSIRQWDRDAFASDKYGRNFLGVPNQGRADFAFIQHILASMDNSTGRCAILLPHGILNRKEEQKMRQGLVERDLVECIIGLGKNLFYNSPMEACILVCRTQKDIDRRNKVLFIDGRKYVTRQGTESYLTEEQFGVIANAYADFDTVEGLCAVATLEEIKANDVSLAINRYVGHEFIDEDLEPADVMASEWADHLDTLHKAIEAVSATLEDSTYE